MAQRTRRAKQETQELTINVVRQWREDAVADGWMMEPTYLRETVDEACTLWRKGWKAMLIARPNYNRRTGADSVSIAVWGPDELTVEAPVPYDWEQLQAALHRCNYCHEEGEVERIGFAGRACPDCHEELRPQIEFPGWTR